TTFVDKGLTPNTTYYYIIYAFNAIGYSADSAEINATTKDIAPAAPVMISATADSSSQITLKWEDKSSNEAGFRLEVSGDNGSTFKPIAPDFGANATTYVHSGLIDGTKYYYRIKAFNSAGESSYSNTVNATTLLPAPSNLIVKAATNGTVIALSWKKNSTTQSGFEIEVSIDNGVTYSPLKTVSTIAYAHIGVNPGAIYFYRVRAVNKVINSGYSTRAFTLTPLQAPKQLTAQVISRNQINLFWSRGAANETLFKIERSDGNMNNFKIIATVNTRVNVSSYSFPSTGLTRNTRYYYRVRAVNNLTQSGYSNTVSATTKP
ncbi:MAG: fibronectin type III domain-containing protein, partial [Candidatus Omnitrophica bacterium]|nr:fibronectin type III domain-containing protein [Candidatus Omnitrophota bacterium]